MGANLLNYHWLSNTTAHSLDSAQTLLGTYNSTDDEKGYSFSIINDLAYRLKLDSSGRELDIDLSHTYVTGINNAPLNSTAYDSSGNYDAANSLHRRSYATNNIHNAIFQLDYIHPLKLKGFKIEAGAKNETTVNKNVFNAYETVNNIENKDSII